MGEVVIVFKGEPGSGKSRLSRLIERHLKSLGLKVARPTHGEDTLFVLPTDTWPKDKLAGE